MRYCSICCKTKADSAFWSNRYKGRLLPLCSPCFDRWRELQIEQGLRTFTANSNIERNKANSTQVEAWQFGQLIASKPKQNRFESIRERLMHTLKNSSLPVNPRYIR